MTKSELHDGQLVDVYLINRYSTTGIRKVTGARIRRNRGGSIHIFAPNYVSGKSFELTYEEAVAAVKVRAAAALARALRAVTRLTNIIANGPKTKDFDPPPGAP